MNGAGDPPLDARPALVAVPDLRRAGAPRYCVSLFTIAVMAFICGLDL